MGMYYNVVGNYSPRVGNFSPERSFYGYFLLSHK